MKIAMIADLHGNLAALKAVANDIARRGINKIYCLGDLVGKGPQSPETMDWALANCQVVLKGNWDEEIHGTETTQPSWAWHRAQLGEKRLAQLRALPMEHRFTMAGRKIRLLHGRPLSPLVYSDSDIAQRKALFVTGDDYKPDIVGFADIHRPFYEQIDGAGILFNTGSVGNPLAGQPYASYVILEADDASGCLSHTIVQLPYDREEAVRRTRAVPDLPLGDAFINEVRTGQYSRQGRIYA